tara:strand:+ start:123 stop:683 length:561 start_codon:yes stop_codon:yes gene_type:complete
MDELVEMENSFNQTYAKKLWTKNHPKADSLSGKGSFTKNTREYFNFLNEFIFKNDIKSMTDYGCGDGKILEDIKIDNYLGIDIAKIPIDDAKKKYPFGNFRCEKTFAPDASDLLHIKHVLGHWRGVDIVEPKNHTHKIYEFIETNKNKFKYILINDGLCIIDYLPIGYTTKKIGKHYIFIYKNNHD